MTNRSLNKRIWYTLSLACPLMSAEAFTIPSCHYLKTTAPFIKNTVSTRLCMSIDESDSRKKDDKTEEQNQPNLNIPSIDYRELEEIQMTEEELEREVKKYRLQTEIDTIMNDPEGAPFDLESELKLVTGGISPPMDYDSPEMEIEEKVHEVESEMYAAVETKNFKLAQSKKDELSKMHIDDIGSVLQVNSAFYRAFSNKDYDMMEQIWLHDASALCIHPSNAPLIGAKNVLNSWKEMFADGNDAFQKNKIEPSNLRLAVKGTTAIITCDEDVYTRRFIRGKKRVGKKDSKNGMELVNKLLTTNIFRKVSDRWYMIHHHAAWHHESEAAKHALNPKRGGGIGTNRGGPPQSKIVDPNSLSSSSTVEGMLGIPGHEGLGGDSNQGAEEGKPVRRIIRGSLSDLLGGGLGDLLAGNDVEGDSDNMDMGMGGLGDGVDSIIIRSEDLTDNKDEDDDDDDDDDDDIIINGNIKKTNVVRLEPETSDKKSQPKDTIRQNCIQSMRQLAKDGAISQKQKRMLLTDIIVKSSSGDYSMVEVAYDLLCSEGDDEDAGKEDFAEQCKVFAASLPEVPIPFEQNQEMQ